MRIKRKYIPLTIAAVACAAALTMAGCEKKDTTAPQSNDSLIDLPINTETQKPVYTDDTEQTTNVNESSPDETEDTENLSSDIQAELAKLEEQDNAINDRLRNESLTQDEMNRLTAQRYKLWDDELNSIWAHLKDTLDEGTMSKLTEEERSWISDKDSKVEAAGKEAEGGTMQPMLENDEAADITRERVYELAQYYK